MLSWIYNELWSECSIFCCRKTSSEVNDTLSKAYRCVPTSSEFGCVSRWNLLTLCFTTWVYFLILSHCGKKKEKAVEWWFLEAARSRDSSTLKKKRINPQDRLRYENRAVCVCDWEEMKVSRGKMRRRKEESTRHTNLSKVRTLHSCTCALMSEHVCVLN